MKRRQSKPERIVRRLANRYVVHNVGLESAALAFYLVFAIFPFLILLSVLMGFFQLDLQDALASLANLLPSEVVSILKSFLRYAAGRPSAQLLASTVAISIYFPMRATNSLMFSVRKAYHLGSPRGVIIQTVKNLIYTLVLIVTVVLSAALMTVSDRLLALAVEYFRLPEFVARLWTALRFPVTAVVAYFALYFLYALAQDSRQGWQNLWPGTMAALGGWMAASWCYAFYVNHIAHYSLLYGSIGTIIVLLIWLNLTSMVLILGAELNGVLMSLRADGADKTDEPEADS